MSKALKSAAIITIVCIMTMVFSLKTLACDTYVALSDATKDGSVLFGKTSNRGNNECMWQAYYPGGRHKAGEMVKVSHMEISQVPVTYAVWGGQPYWGYGFEYGMNEKGVCIGNEALYTKDPVYPAEDGKSLTGMDMVRLALERGRNAYEAMHVIIDLLEKYGQNGNCSGNPKDNSLYWNSFLIADPNEAWVLETSDRNWVAKKIKSGVWAISNVATIRTTWDECSDDLITHAIKQGWCTADEPFDFSKFYTDFNVWPQYGIIKLSRSSSLLEKFYGKIDLNVMMSIGRDHFEGSMLESRYGPMFQWNVGFLCGHDFEASIAGGMIAHLRKDSDIAAPLQNMCWGAMSSPCCSVYRPFYFVGEAPKELMLGNNTYSEDSPWWAFDLLERMACKNQEAFMPLVRGVWNSIEIDEIAAAEMIEKEATRLINNGKTKEAANLLSNFMRKNLMQQLAVAKQLAKVMTGLYAVLPHKTDLVHPKDASDKAAGITLFQ